MGCEGVVLTASPITSSGRTEPIAAGNEVVRRLRLGDPGQQHMVASIWGVETYSDSEGYSWGRCEVFLIDPGDGTMPPQTLAKTRAFLYDENEESTVFKIELCDVVLDRNWVQERWGLNDRAIEAINKGKGLFGPIQAKIVPDPQYEWLDE